MQRPGWKTIEVAVCVLLLSGLFCCGVMLIQQRREDARSSTCQGKLKQLWFALENYTIVNRAYPAGTMAAGQKGEYSSWIVALMTQFEQRDWYQQIQQEYDLQPSPFQPTPHSSLSHFNTTIACPSDRFHSTPQLSTRYKIDVASTSYLGISGLASQTPQGILFYDSQVRPNDVTDGLSMTLLVGERPISGAFNLGWWYAGLGASGRGDLDHTLGVQEQLQSPPSWLTCESRSFVFPKRDPASDCDAMNFWSYHPGGAQFVLADGTVRFLSYGCDTVLRPMATRNAGD